MQINIFFSLDFSFYYTFFQSISKIRWAIEGKLLGRIINDKTWKKEIYFNLFHKKVFLVPNILKAVILIFGN